MKTNKIILFLVVLVLLAGAVCATDISDDTISNKDTQEKIVTDTQTVSQTDAVMQESNMNNKIEKSLNDNKKASADKIIEKSADDKINIKQATITVNSWDTFVTAFNDAKTKTQDTTIFLERGIYTISDPLEWNNTNILLTIDGNNQTIDGNQRKVFTINSECSMLLKNITITKAYGYNDRGGAISNYGNLNITDSILSHNSEVLYIGGGAIYSSGNLTIINSTLNNNRVDSCRGGAIYNSNGNLTIINSTLFNNTSSWDGGAIEQYMGYLTLNDSIFENNTAGMQGGAICLYGYPVDAYFNISNSNFTENTANQGAAIYALDDARGNLTGNTFKENTATENGETLTLQNTKLEDNTYYSTDFDLSEVKLFIESDTFHYGDDIILNYTLSLRNPTYYDSDILNQIEDIKLYINGVENVTTKYENYTLSSLDIGSYEVYYTTCKRESNKVTFSVLLYSQISADKESYDYYDGITNNITLAITDEDGEKGTIDVYVKGGEYTKVLTYYNVKDKYKISTEALKKALENIYTDLDSSYTINITYNSNSDIVNPSSTEFTLNIIKQRNTSIIYDILNNTEGNVQINITVIDTVYKTAVPDSQIEVTGNITKTTTSGVITDNTLTPGDYTINVKYSQTDEYAESDATIDFTVEIDKDAKIAELEDNITELTNQLEELNNKTNNLTSQLEDAKTQITTLNDTVNDLTQDLKNANNTIKELNARVNNLTKENKKLNDTINNLTNQNKQLEAKNKNLTDTIIQLENNIKTLENAISQLESIIEELNKTPTKNATTVTISKVTGQVGTVTKLKATVKDSNGKAVKDGNVLFKVNGITLKDADGNILYGAVDNGVATINYTIPKSWYKNTTTVEAVYAGNSIYLSSRANNSKNSISQGNVNIKLDDLSSYENGDAIKFVVTVTDKEKNPITGGTVIIKANGVTLKDSGGNPLQANVVNGLAVLDYNITLSAKVYNITAVYSYTGYNRIEAKAKLNVTKAMTFIKYDPVKTNTTKTRITANIINRNEVGINTTVGIKIDGKLVNTTKSVNGLVNISVPTNITAGIHAIEFTVGESGCYKSNRLTSVIIKK